MRRELTSILQGLLVGGCAICLPLVFLSGKKNFGVAVVFCCISLLISWGTHFVASSVLRGLGVKAYPLVGLFFPWLLTLGLAYLMDTEHLAGVCLVALSSLAGAMCCNVLAALGAGSGESGLIQLGLLRIKPILGCLAGMVLGSSMLSVFQGQSILWAVPTTLFAGFFGACGGVFPVGMITRSRRYRFIGDQVSERLEAPLVVSAASLGAIAGVVGAPWMQADRHPLLGWQLIAGFALPLVGLVVGLHFANKD